MSVDIQEFPEFSFQKRHLSRHYPFEDYHDVTTSLGYTEATVLGAALVNVAAGQLSSGIHYILGTNARGKTNPASVPANQPYNLVNWPTGCYAREALFRSTEDCRISIVSINPAYLEDLVQYNATGGLKAIEASQLLYGKEFFVVADEYIRWYPLYGYMVIFRADTVAGTLRMWFEGSVEGSEA